MSTDRALGLRPLTPRSLVLSVLLGNHPPSLPVEALVRLVELFGIKPGTLRTALSRMVDAGELTNRDGTYELTGRMLGRQREQDTGLVDPDPSWDGAWWTAVVTAERRTMAERRQFRSAMTGARMGELRPDIWMRPANTTPPPAEPDLLITRGALTSGDPFDLTSRLWDLPAVDARAARLTDRLLAADEDMTEHGATALADAFIVSAACVQFLRTEPRLPRDLVRSRSAAELRKSYAPVNDRFRNELRRFLSE